MPLIQVEIKPGTDFYDWIDAHLNRRYDYVCTEDLEEFQHAKKSVTKEGLIKNIERHEKDDRPRVVNRNNYILGWDNREKIEAFQAQLAKLKDQVRKAEQRMTQLKKGQKALTDMKELVGKFGDFDNFHDIHWQHEAEEIRKLQEKRDELQASSEELKALERQHQDIKGQIQRKEGERDSIVEQKVTSTKDIEDYQKRLEDHTETLRQYDHINIHEYLSRLQPFLTWLKAPLNLENIDRAKNSIHNKVSKIRSQKNNEREAIKDALLEGMAPLKYPSEELLDKYPDWPADTLNLQISIESLPGYIERYRRLQKEDLPTHEGRFKKWLNEQVALDIGHFSASLNDQIEIFKENIAELNKSLEQIEFNTHLSTYIHIQTQEVRDHGERGVMAFRRTLREAIPNIGKMGFNDTQELERSYKKIKTLIDDMTEDEAWRKKVTDVRNWLKFHVIEKFKADGKSWRVYTDSQSLSGGEKAQLAYTILASAIAYQFGINCKDGRTESFRFIVVDEAFSKVDPDKAKYAMELFQRLNLQLMVVTPLDKHNIVEPYIHTVHYVDRKNYPYSTVYDLPIEEYHQKKQSFKPVRN